MLKKLAAAAALLAVLTLASPASANHTLAHKVKRLQAQVKALATKMACLQKYPVYSYSDFPDLNSLQTVVVQKADNSGPVDVIAAPPAAGFSASAIDFSYERVGRSDAFFLGPRNTRFCQRKFRLAGDPRPAARRMELGRMR